MGCSSQELLAIGEGKMRRQHRDAAQVKTPIFEHRQKPLAPARYKIQFTAGAELHDKLERLQALMCSSVPDGDLATIIEVAVTEKLERLESRRFGK